MSSPYPFHLANRPHNLGTEEELELLLITRKSTIKVNTSSLKRAGATRHLELDIHRLLALLIVRLIQ